MTLPASQQRALNAIDDGLSGVDPGLARMFGVFAQLTRQDEMPAAETLSRRRWLPGQAPRWLPPVRLRRRLTGWPPGRLHRVLVLPLLIMATLSLLAVAILTTPSGAQRRCGSQVAALIGPVQSAAAPGCGGRGRKAARSGQDQAADSNSPPAASRKAPAG